MNCIDEEEEEADGDMTIRSVDQFPSIRPPPEYRRNKQIYSRKQITDEIDHRQYQTTNRSTSLPSRQAFSSNLNSEENVKQRRRYTSDSNNNNKNFTTSLVTSFIQYLRSELRATTNDKKHDHLRIPKKKSVENLNHLSETNNFSNNFYRQQYPIRMSSSSTSSSLSSQSNELRLSNEDLLKNTFDNSDDNEIFKLINLLILRVECLANENTSMTKTKNYPTIKQIDQNLIEYLYYLFNKFRKEESDFQTPMIDKTNFVNVCQTLVRNGCFNIPSSTSPDQSFSDATITNNSNLTLTQTIVHDCRSDTNDRSLNEQTSSPSKNNQEAWLVVDLEAIKPQDSATIPDESKCFLPSSTSDEQLLLPNEYYFSFEEIKSCESESSQSNYYSPNSSLVDLQNMVQEFDEINNTNNNNNNTLFNEDGSSAIDHALNKTNVIIEAHDSTSNNNICKGLIIDGSNEHVASSSIESMTMKAHDQMSRRERKMQERWTISTKTEQHEQLPTKTFLGVEFPPIAVLRKKFSSLPTSPPILNPLPMKKKDSSSMKTKTLLHQTESNEQIQTILLKPSISVPNQEINTSMLEKTKHDQVFDLQINDTGSLNDIQQSSKLLTHEKNVYEDMTSKIHPESNLSVTNLNNEELIIDFENFNSPSSSSLLSISSSSSSSSSSLTTNTNENKASEVLLKEIEEEEKKEEEHCDDDNVDVEKKNDCNVEHNDHAPGTILINVEPTHAVLLEQEKRGRETEQPSSLLPTEKSCNQPQTEDESLVSILANNLEEMTMTNIDENEQRYKTVEIEEIPDEEEDLSIHNNPSIEPTDCILTDDELKISQPANIKTTKNTPPKIDPVLSCYEKALSKTVETIDDSTKFVNTSFKESQIPPIPKRSQRPEDDPIALRALERFEQRMNAATAAKITNEETNSLATKGKSSWSGTFSTPRKSLENLFKTNQQSQSNALSNGEESTTATLPSPRETFIRPRKTMLDDMGLNFGMTLNLFGTGEKHSTINNDNYHHHLVEQQQPTAIIDDDNKQIVSDVSTINMIDSEDQQQQEQPMNINASMTNESAVSNEAENLNSLLAPPLHSSSTNSSLNTVISHSSTEQQSVTPYCLQLEGRRRLNTLERIHERRSNHQSNDLSQQQPSQFQNEYTVKPEDLQDPIIRRALERFDEKSRSLAQTKSTNYDEIQDPITRRALMRLETNLKRTIPSNPPPSTIHNDHNETWYTNSYTLGSLQTNPDNRFIRYPDPTLPPTSNQKPSHVSVHQRFCSTSSSDMSEVSTNNILLNNEQDIPPMRVPLQPVYVTTNNHQPPQQPISARQRSRSADMLSTKDLSIGHTTNLDENEVSPLQRNHSSEELQQQEPSVFNETDFPVTTTIIQSLDPNFIRTTEASVNYQTPTQSYAAYSCEYTRPHQNQLITSPQPESLSSPRNLQQPQQPENEIQYSNSSSAASAFTLVHPLTNNSYSQRPLPTPSYNSMYTSNNLNQTPYSDDPIVRRALERFNSQMQNSLMSMSQHQPSMNYMSRQVPNGYPPRQGNFDSYQPVDPHQYEAWINANRPIAPPPPPSNTGTGYQSIIGRRRQMRQDDIYHDNTSVGNGYSSSLFLNSSNSYPYMNFSDEPPVIPPRLHRDMYHEQQEYLTENMNNNNNNHPPFIPHVYPTMNGFRPINHQYLPPEFLQQFQEDEYLRYRAQSTSSNTSSDSVNPSRFIHQRLPPTTTRTNLQPNKNISPDNTQLLSGQTTPSNGSGTGDSVFHRLAYTATKSSLSKSSSNLCANVLPKTSLQPKSNSFKAQEIEYEEPIINNEPNQESISTPTNLTNKCQRSRSVDGRARLKNAQTRANNSTRPSNDDDDNNHQSTTVPSSKFTPINPRRDVPPPRMPTTPRSIIPDRTSSTKRVLNGHNLPYPKNTNGIRTRNSNGNLIDSENDENIAFNDSYQPKIIDSKTRTAIPVHRYSTNNHIQTSASTSSVNSTNFRTKVPILTSTNLDRRDSNVSGTDLNRSSKRIDENRLLSPPGQRRNIPVSVFAPAKLENKRSAPPIPPPSSSSPTNESMSTSNCESQQDPQTSYSSVGDSIYTAINNENELNNKLSLTNSTLKTSTGNLLNDISLTNDKHDNSKKMNVFERLFRGHKKKI